MLDRHEYQNEQEDCCQHIKDDEGEEADKELDMDMDITDADSMPMLTEGFKPQLATIKQCSGDEKNDS